MKMKLAHKTLLRSYAITRPDFGKLLYAYYSAIGTHSRDGFTAAERALYAYVGALERERDAATVRAERAEAENARLRELAEALADAADDVGVQHFDTDTIPGYVGAMQAATLAVRAALAPVESKGGDDGR